MVTINKHRQLRSNIRNWLDRFESAARDDEPVALSSEACGDLSTMLREIQDAAAKDLGYE